MKLSSDRILGKNNFLTQPEFNTTAKIKSIFDKFEDKEVISSIEETGNDINIYIVGSLIIFSIVLIKISTKKLKKNK